MAPELLQREQGSPVLQRDQLVGVHPDAVQGGGAAGVASFKAIFL
jgi:hypothetical protein